MTVQKEYKGNGWYQSWDIKQTLGTKYTGWKLVRVAIKAAIKYDYDTNGRIKTIKLGG